MIFPLKIYPKTFSGCMYVYCFSHLFIIQNIFSIRIFQIFSNGWQVKGGTAVPNVIEFAKKALQSGEHRTIVWTGYGGGAGKTISCAEILKRDFTLHQVTRLCYKTYGISSFTLQTY